MATVLFAEDHLIRAFGDCTAEEGHRLLNEGWEYIEKRCKQPNEPIPSTILRLKSVAGVNPISLVQFNDGDVRSQRGHVKLVLAALAWFASGELRDATVKECHPTQSNGQADLWVTKGNTHYICEATAKESWDNWAKKKLKRGAGSGLTKRRHQVEILERLAARLKAANPECKVIKCHILPKEIAQEEAVKFGKTSRVLHGSSVLVSFD